MRCYSSSKGVFLSARGSIIDILSGSSSTVNRYLSFVRTDADGAVPVIIHFLKTALRTAYGVGIAAEYGFDRLVADCCEGQRSIGSGVQLQCPSVVVAGVGRAHFYSVVAQDDAECVAVLVGAAHLEHTFAALLHRRIIETELLCASVIIHFHNHESRAVVALAPHEAVDYGQRVEQKLVARARFVEIFRLETLVKQVYVAESEPSLLP